ncbi:SOS response-associated peptidase [Streptomyces albus subsp. chlorinus]|uniref:SOS response-associated peptidase n=1 Tax=Streptomyces albus TaxID=1888 RepID=UPI00156F9784|nr:SOS response-associated peptidase [Streptomyces albus]NSC23791.1 SOS response-associated peptidase [Streptomyces albus subsp. chlorinus]
MCGRYAASRGAEDLVRLFEVEKWEPEEAPAPDWNVAPTKQVHAVLERPLKGSGDPRPVRQLRPLKWGLVPGWAKSPDMGVKMINARAETVHEKPAYRRPFVARRCLLPADGYYEWVTAEGELKLEQEGKRKRPRKQPYFISPAGPAAGSGSAADSAARGGSGAEGESPVMAMAGLYEFWRDTTLPDDHPRAWWATCTVITTAAETTPLANADQLAEGGPGSLADIHPRMPLMLTPDRWDAWLDPSHTDPGTLRELLTPPPAGMMRAHPVSTDVSNVRNNGPHLLKELPAPEEETLF